MCKGEKITSMGPLEPQGLLCPQGPQGPQCPLGPQYSLGPLGPVSKRHKPSTKRYRHLGMLRVGKSISWEEQTY